MVHQSKNYPNKADLISMQNFILPAPKGYLVDHRDRNGLNNQKSNLRICTRSQNQQNRAVSKKSKSGYKGVYWNKRKRKFVTTIMFEKKSIFLGYFVDINDAIKTYNAKAKELFGEFAWLNKIED